MHPQPDHLMQHKKRFLL